MALEDIRSRKLRKMPLEKRVKNLKGKKSGSKGALKGGKGKSKK